MYILHKNMKSGSGLSLSFEAPVANEDSTITLIAKILFIHENLTNTIFFSSLSIPFLLQLSLGLYLQN